MSIPGSLTVAGLHKTPYLQPDFSFFTGSGMNGKAREKMFDDKQFNKCNRSIPKIDNKTKIE